jgi:transposase
MRAYTRYSIEFRNEAISLYRRTDRTLPDIAESLGLKPVTLREWVKQDTMKRKKRAPQSPSVPKSETVDERLARLERENKQLLRKVAQLEDDREILKKAAAFFAKESE